MNIDAFIEVFVKEQLPVRGPREALDLLNEGELPAFGVPME